jgi:predicted short-subunit dehydrogenase-like oxidoreductase (DUF2520 family)
MDWSARMASLPSPPFDVALIGAGSVGTGVAALLKRAGQRIVAVTSRSASSARRGAEILGAVAVDDPSDLPRADVYLIGTGAEAVRDVAASLADSRPLSGSVAIHFAGAVGIAPLEPARAGGAEVLALHPVQACPNVEAAIRNLPGSVWGATTSPDSEMWARGLIEMLEGEAVRVAESDRVPWHAAAVVTSNGIAALAAGGESILRSIGVEHPERVLGPLAEGTLTNARLGGGGAATLTGPIVRGEVEVVEMHAKALNERPELGDIYRSVSRLIAQVASASGRLDENGYRAVMDALEVTP